MATEMVEGHDAKMALITVSSWSQTLTRRRETRDFEYDESKFCYSEEALRHIELLMMGNQSFEVAFYTEIDSMRSNLVNHLLFQAAGHKSALQSKLEG